MHQGKYKRRTESWANARAAVTEAVELRGRWLRGEKRLTMRGLRFHSTAVVGCLLAVMGGKAVSGCSVYDEGLLQSSVSAPSGGGDSTEGGAGAAQVQGGAGTASGSGQSHGGSAGSAESGASAGQGEGGAAGQGEGGMPEPTGGGAGSSGAGSAGAPPSLGLRHRYSFSGSGVNVADTVGTAAGTVVNTQLDGSGKVTFAAAALPQYVDLPNGILSELGNATVEVWFSWSGTGGAWQRVFDFGSSDAGEGIQGVGATYLFLSPKSSTSQLRGTIRTSSTNGELLISDALATVDQIAVVAIVVDDDHDTMTMYRDGTFRSSVAFLGHLSEIQDVNDWLGRSQFKDAAFIGSIDELRIYSSALAASAIASSFAKGPDALIAP